MIKGDLRRLLELSIIDYGNTKSAQKIGICEPLTKKCDHAAMPL